MELLPYPTVELQYFVFFTIFASNGRRHGKAMKYLRRLL
jgi:hypothetical protein